MVVYTSFVRFDNTESWRAIKDSDCKSKKAFLEMLKMNGYKVRYNEVFTEEQTNDANYMEQHALARESKARISRDIQKMKRA